ncbi:MAG: RsiV family protein [Candidatus Limivicinus sp.]
MKRTLSLLLASALLLLCGCGSKALPRQETGQDGGHIIADIGVSPQPARPEILHFYEEREYFDDWDGDTRLCHVEYPLFTLDNEDAADFPGLNASVEEFNAQSSRIGADIRGELAGGALEFRELDEENFSEFFHETRCFIPRADSRAVSILSAVNKFTGGQYNDYYFRCANFDTLSGRQLSLEDVMTDTAALPELLAQQLLENYPEAEFFGLEESLEAYMEDTAAFTWSLDYGGLSFYFSPYELAPYADGLLTVSLSFSRYPDLFSEYYISTPSAYAQPIIAGRAMNYDLDLDGRNDEISTRAAANEESGLIEKLEIGVNGREITVSTGIKDYDAYVLRAGPGRSYLFINAANLSSHGYISVYKLNRSGAELAGMLYNTSLQAAGFTDFCPGKPVLTDPTEFRMGTRTELLGTMTGIKSYHTGNSGLPESDEEFYALDSDTVLTSKRSFITATLDPRTGGGSGSTANIPAGTKFYFWRSDGRSFVDMYTDAGVYCRLYVSGKGEGQQVNGMPAMESFDGIKFQD